VKNRNDITYMNSRDVAGWAPQRSHDSVESSEYGIVSGLAKRSSGVVVIGTSWTVRRSYTHG
jgi:hypothetical protein